jgi:hypothetical protein
MGGSAFFRPPAGFARTVRKTCDNCGSAALTWGTLGDLILIAEQVSPSDREKVLDLFPLRSEAWLCCECGNLGVFSDWEHE